MSSINRDILHFAKLSGLSDHRVGTLLAKNGFLVERARNGGRYYPETMERIYRNLRQQIERRGLEMSGFEFLDCESAK